MLITEPPPFISEPEEALLAPTGDPEVEVRFAGPEDREGLLDAAFACLVEIYAAGGDLLPTPGNVEVFGQFFDQVVDDPTSGAAIVAVRDGILVGFSMATSIDGPLETRFGHTAYGWGTYVTPSHRRLGLSAQLRDALEDALREVGFDYVLGGVHPGNETAICSLERRGFEIFQLHGAKSLRGE